MSNYFIVNNLLNFLWNFFILTRHTERITPNVIHLRAPAGLSMRLLFRYEIFSCFIMSIGIIFFSLYDNITNYRLLLLIVTFLHNM